VRLQLRSPRRGTAALYGLCGLVALAGATLPAARARATQDAAARVTFFREPSSENSGISVVHPQLDLGTTLGPDFHLAAGYEVDIVSGATPAVFGPRTTGVDVVTRATPFSDTRHQVHGALAYQRPTSSVALGYSYGWESDYRSSAITGSTSSDLLDHNFTLALSYTHNFDSVCDANNSNIGDQLLDLKPLGRSDHCFKSAETDVATRKLAIDTFQPSLSWTATPKLLLQLGSTIQILDGFQSNPYRSVLVGMQHRTPQEHMPEYRQRYAVYARAVYALPAVRASGLFMARLYQDSWAVQAATGEILLNKYFGSSLLVTVRGRYHLQGGASFYRDGKGYLELGPGGKYWTGDRELSPMSNYLTGGKLAFLRRPEQEKTSWFVEMDLSVKYELLLYHLDSPDAPNVDRTKAHIVQAAFSVTF
jgi:Protein of unknown function (DUF3570)